MEKAKEKITKQCRIGDTCFTSFETIGSTLFTRHPKNFTHVHEDSTDILAVIIFLGEKFHGDDEEKMRDTGKIAHVLKHSNGSCVVVLFDKNLHKGSIWTGHRAV